MTGSVVSKQWPELEKCDNLLSSHFWFLDDRSWKKQQLFCLHTFTFMMTGTGKKRKPFVSTLSPSWSLTSSNNKDWQGYGSSLGLEYTKGRGSPATCVGLHQITPLHLPPLKVGAATFVLLPLVVIFLATQTQLFMWPFTPVVKTLLPSSNEILCWHRQTHKRRLLNRESLVCHWLLREADPSCSYSQWLDACPLAPVSSLG